MTTLAVLAGGEGSRMGGSKDRLTVRGRPVLVDLLERIGWQGPTVLIASHDGPLPVGHELFREIVRDEVRGRGPLQGLVAALAGRSGCAAVFVPVDMPRIAGGHVRWFAQELAARPEARGLMARHGTRVEPFPCALRSSVEPTLRERLERGERSIHGLARGAGVEVIEAPEMWDESVWNSVNTPTDLPEGWERSG